MMRDLATATASPHRRVALSRRAVASAAFAGVAVGTPLFGRLSDMPRDGAPRDAALHVPRRRASYDDGEKTAQDGSTTNGSESDDSESERGRKRALSMPDLGSPTSVNEPAESMSDDPPMEMKRAKSLSDLQPGLQLESADGVTTCA